MQMKMLANGTVRILLTDRELAHFHTDFFNLRENDPKTATALRRILKAACPDMLKTTKRRQLSVEAAPIEGGCLLFISPQNAREETLFCLCAADTAALCALLAAAKRTLGGNTVAAVYRLADRFFLLLYGAPFPATAVAALAEFSEHLYSDRLSGARIVEHGTPLCGGTLSSLTVPGCDG
mgnify:FL=1